MAYRDTVAEMNLLTRLIDHRDTRKANFLLSKDEEHPRAFSIDNSLAFSGLMNPATLLVPGWRELKVPGLPHRVVERLRRLTRADLDRLGTVAQFAIDEHGQLRATAPAPPIDPDEGVRHLGSVIQLGLTRSEIDDVEERVRDVLRAVDEGRTQER